MLEQATAFDRAMALLECPDAFASRASTIVENDALLGHGATYILQMAYQKKRGFTLFAQRVDVGGSAMQAVFGPKVMDTIRRLMQSTQTRARRKPKKPLTREQRQEQRVREARRIIRESKKNGK